jgi:hypothetical protein
MILEDNCKSEFKTERAQLIELIQRDPSLTEDDAQQEKVRGEEANKVNEEINKYF